MWEQIPLKRIARINPEVLSEDTDADFQIVYVDIGGVTLENGIRDVEILRFGDAPSRARRRVKAGDAIVSTVRTYLRAIAEIADPPDNMIVSTGFAVIRGYRKIDTKYLAWALRCSEFVEQVVANSVGVSYPAIAPTALGDIPIAVPPIHMQPAIATFLSAETAKIDALIAKQTEFLTRLDEHRRALITEAVTRGLDSRIPTKETGGILFNEIPAHWAIKRLKYLAAEVTVGVVVTPSKYYADQGVPALRSLNVRPMGIIKEDLVFFDANSNRVLSKSMMKADDLVAVRTGKPGTTAVVPPDFDGANCIDLILIRRSSRFNSRFLAYVMNSDLAQMQYGEGSEGAIQQHFNIETAKNLLLPTPPVAEQEAIARYLDSRTAQLDATHERSSRMIAMLRERRSALITATVTGQIDVNQPSLVEAAA
jgi:type I restriction enzyme S subunit